MRRRKPVFYPVEVPFARAMPEFIGVNEVANLLCLSRSTVYAMLRRQRMPKPVGRVRGRLRFSRSAIVEWARAGFPTADDWERS